MATKTATLVLKIKTAGEKSLASVKAGFSNLKSSLSAMIGPAIAATAAIGAVVAAAGKLAVDASKFEEIKTAFTNMANKQGQDADMMLAKMRELSAGTVNDMELMKQANNALLLGLPVEKFGEMLNIARSSAKATGQSMEFMLSSIVTGLGRGSKMILDNLGIVFDVNKAYEEYAATLGKTASQLTDAEKKQAFINKALEIGTANAKAAGSGSESLNDKWEQLKTSAQNLAVVLGQSLIPVFTALSDAAKGAVSLFTNIDEDQRVASMSSKQLAGNIRFLQARLDGLYEKAEERRGKLFSFGGESEEIVAVTAEMERLKEALAAQLAEEEKIAGFKEAKKEQDLLDKEEEIARQTEHNAMLAEMQNQSDAELTLLRLQEQEKSIASQMANEKNQTKLLDLELKRRKNLKDQEALTDKKRYTALNEFNKWMQDNEIKEKQSTFATIASLSQSSNSTLAAIGKAAALTNIAISTAEGVARALGAFPPPVNFAMAAAVGAAGAVQAGKVAGIALAEGGIVMGSPGGTPAIVGEGGRNEAVIPLDDEEGAGAIGTTINLTVNGGLLGDTESARELAIALDEELFKLRQNNETVAFDQGLT